MVLNLRQWSRIRRGGPVSSRFTQTKSIGNFGSFLSRSESRTEDSSGGELMDLHEMLDLGNKRAASFFQTKNHRNQHEREPELKRERDNVERASLTGVFGVRSFSFLHKTDSSSPFDMIFFDSKIYY